MEFLQNLSKLQIFTGFLFLLAKLFGFCALVSLGYAFVDKDTILPAIFGVLWGLFIVLSIVFCVICFLQDRKEEIEEKQLYEKLKKKYG